MQRGSYSRKHGSYVRRVKDFSSMEGQLAKKHKVKRAIAAGIIIGAGIPLALSAGHSWYKVGRYAKGLAKSKRIKLGSTVHRLPGHVLSPKDKRSLFIGHMISKMQTTGGAMVGGGTAGAIVAGARKHRKISQDPKYIKKQKALSDMARRYL